MAIGDAVKLKLYNEAIALLKETRLASLTESREMRRRLDDVWDAGIIDLALEKGQWHFASRIVSLTYNPSIEPADDSYGYVIDKPSDLVRLTAFCSDGRLEHPVLRYQEVGAYWLCDFDTVWLKYVSNDDSYGLDTSLWPDSFREVVEAVLAEKAAPSTASEAVLDRVAAQLKKRLANAVSLGAMAGPTRFQPQGSWSTARGGGSGFNHNRR